MRGSSPPDSLIKNSVVTSCAGGSASGCRKNRWALAADGVHARAQEQREIAPVRTGARSMQVPLVTIGLVSIQSDVGGLRIHCARRAARGSGSGCSGPGVSTSRSRQVDLRARITQVAFADPVRQMNDPMNPRIVLDGKLAELRINAELVAKPLVKLFHLRRFFRGPSPGPRRTRFATAACARCWAASTLTTRLVFRSTVEKTVMSSK